MVLGDKYEYYVREVKQIKISESKDPDDVVYLTKDFTNKTPEGMVLDKLKLFRPCCRRHMLTHVDIE
tara:strand:+ start:292 stop:492 length:201 start_codon:yes stop_codon:yes gene_type:complete